LIPRQNKESKRRVQVATAPNLKVLACIHQLEELLVLAQVLLRVPAVLHDRAVQAQRLAEDPHSAVTVTGDDVALEAGCSK
jgi:hypothetical protein